MARRKSNDAFDIDDLHFEMKGQKLFIGWGKDNIAAINLGAVSLLWRQMTMSEAEYTSQPENKFIEEFAASYSRMKERYSGKRYWAKPGQKTWDSIVKAAKQCRDMKVDPDIYVEAVRRQLSKFRNENTLPWPSQLHGENAEMAVANFIASTRSDPHLIGKHKAENNRDVPIDEDTHLLKIKKRMKSNTHTWEDMAYMETRYKQVYKGLPKWWEKYINRLKEREKNESDSADKR